MNALDYILANYQQEKYQENLAERAVLRALVHTLDKEELLILQKKLKRGSSKWSVGKGLYEEAIKVLGKIQPHRNESISTLLKAFTDKQSGLVAETRAELRDRFGKQSFLTQRKILKAMLHASKQDRMWAYNRLNYSWDGFFFEDVQDLWEQYHEKECGTVVIKHFPKEYVYDNLSALDIQGNYTNLCIKLIHHPKFQIDKERLKEDFVFYGYPEVEYLYILAKSKSKIEKGEATRTLFNQMAVFINTHDTPPKYLGNRSYDLEQQIEEMCVSTKHFDFVSGILWCMGELGLVDELIAFEEWDNMVRIKFLGSEELQYMGNAYSSEEEKELWHLFLQTITECLPTEYQQLVQVKYSSIPKPTKEDLLNNNPALNSLVEKLGLEIVRY
ncbi:MAG: hypothetical protein IKH48_03290 [Prevotella sp.]|nr:hypothetical protein [Prevotella sp.]